MVSDFAIMFSEHASTAIFFSLKKAFAAIVYLKVINHPKCARILQCRRPLYKARKQYEK